jgi:hypothetical protein
LNSFVNNLRDNPMTQFSFKWILSLNCLCQNWGQVQNFCSFLETKMHPCLKSRNC